MSFDVVYMAGDLKRFIVFGIPIGDIPVNQGTLAICEGSHNLESFARLRNTYGGIDVDRDLISEDGSALIRMKLQTSLAAGVNHPV